MTNKPNKDRICLKGRPCVAKLLNKFDRLWKWFKLKMWDLGNFTDNNTLQGKHKMKKKYFCPCESCANKKPHDPSEALILNFSGLINMTEENFKSGVYTFE